MRISDTMWAILLSLVSMTLYIFCKHMIIETKSKRAIIIYKNCWISDVEWDEYMNSKYHDISDTNV